MSQATNATVIAHPRAWSCVIAATMRFRRRRQRPTSGHARRPVAAACIYRQCDAVTEQSSHSEPGTFAVGGLKHPVGCPSLPFLLD